MAAIRTSLQQGLSKLCIYKQACPRCVFGQPRSFSSRRYECRTLFVKSRTHNLTMRVTSLPLLRYSTDHASMSPSSPFNLVEEEMSDLYANIKDKLSSDKTELAEMARYYFDGQGKAFRPMIIMLVSKALNFHNTNCDKLLPSQYQVSLISEMIHTASLVHDDVIDNSDTRRSKPSVHMVWGQRKAILTGDYILSVASIALARIRNEQVVSILSQVIEDLVRGEFMQLGSKEDQDERFKHYLTKTFKKTASLIANSCRAVGVLANCPDEITEIAFQYGRNIGIAFQLIDDLLDFTSCESIMGKPTTADLRLGLATAPVLFATHRFPELNALIMRRFSEPGDVETAREFVARSDGVHETRMLAKFHSEEAVKLIRCISDSNYKTAMINLANFVLTRES